MENNFFLYCFIIIIIFALIYQSSDYNQENFNEQNGQFCYTCNNRTFNQCLQCFNCIWAVNQDGEGACIGGDIKSGPYNYESNIIKYYSTDPWLSQRYRNKKYKCSYGPRQSNRLIGIYP
jgi:hypothetical protein